MPILSWLRACGPVIPGILLLRLELVQLRYMVGHHGARSVMVMNTISLLLLGGHALTSPKGSGALFAQYFQLRGCWPSGFPINVTRIITQSGGRHRSDYGPGHGYPGKIQRKRKQRVCFIYKESVEIPGMGPGESYTGLSGKVRTARGLVVKRP